MNEREQQLVDLMFEAVMYMASDKQARNQPDETIAKWLRKLLRDNGFQNRGPLGERWCLLVDK